MSPHAEDARASLEAIRQLVEVMSGWEDTPVQTSYWRDKLAALLAPAVPPALEGTLWAEVMKTQQECAVPHAPEEPGTEIHARMLQLATWHDVLADQHGSRAEADIDLYRHIATLERAAPPEPQKDAIKIELLSRIQDYLAVGGLFNPEHMEHVKVRDLLIDVRDYLWKPQRWEAQAAAVPAPTTNTTTKGE